MARTPRRRYHSRSNTRFASIPLDGILRVDRREKLALERVELRLRLAWDQELLTPHSMTKVVLGRAFTSLRGRPSGELGVRSVRLYTSFTARTLEHFDLVASAMGGSPGCLVGCSGAGGNYPLTKQKIREICEKSTDYARKFRIVNCARPVSGNEWDAGLSLRIRPLTDLLGTRPAVWA